MEDKGNLGRALILSWSVINVFINAIIFKPHKTCKINIIFSHFNRG